MMRTDVLNQPAFPIQRVSNNGRKIIEARLPAERLADKLGRRHDLGRIARPPRRNDHRDVDAGDPLNRIQYFKHRKTAAITAIERQ